MKGLLAQYECRVFIFIGLWPLMQGITIRDYDNFSNKPSQHEAGSPLHTNFTNPHEYRSTVAKAQKPLDRVPAHLQDLRRFNGFTYDDADDVIHIIEPPKHFEELKRLANHNQPVQGAIRDHNRPLHGLRNSNVDPETAVVLQQASKIRINRPTPTHAETLSIAPLKKPSDAAQDKATATPASGPAAKISFVAKLTSASSQQDARQQQQQRKLKPKHASDFDKQMKVKPGERAEIAKVEKPDHAQQRLRQPPQKQRRAQLGQQRVRQQPATQAQGKLQRLRHVRKPSVAALPIGSGQDASASPQADTSASSKQKATALAANKKPTSDLDLLTDETHYRPQTEEKHAALLLDYPLRMPLEIVASVRKTERLLQKQRTGGLPTPQQSDLKPLIKRRVHSKTTHTIVMEKGYEKSLASRGKETRAGASAAWPKTRKGKADGESSASPDDESTEQALGRRRRDLSRSYPRADNATAPLSAHIYNATQAQRLASSNIEKGVKLLTRISELLKNATYYLPEDNNEPEPESEPQPSRTTQANTASVKRRLYQSAGQLHALIGEVEPTILHKANDARTAFHKPADLFAILERSLNASDALMKEIIKRRNFTLPNNQNLTTPPAECLGAARPEFDKGDQRKESLKQLQSKINCMRSQWTLHAAEKTTTTTPPVTTTTAAITPIKIKSLTLTSAAAHRPRGHKRYGERIKGRSDSEAQRSGRTNEVDRGSNQRSDASDHRLNTEAALANIKNHRVTSENHWQDSNGNSLGPEDARDLPTPHATKKTGHEPKTTGSRGGETLQENADFTPRDIAASPNKVANLNTSLLYDDIMANIRNMLNAKNLKDVAANRHADEDTRNNYRYAHHSNSNSNHHNNKYNDNNSDSDFYKADDIIVNRWQPESIQLEIKLSQQHLAKSLANASEHQQQHHHHKKEEKAEQQQQQQQRKQYQQLNYYLMELNDVITHLTNAETAVTDIFSNDDNSSTQNSNSNNNNSIDKGNSKIRDWYLINNEGKIYETQFNDEQKPDAVIFHRFPDIPNASQIYSQGQATEARTFK